MKKSTLRKRLVKEHFPQKIELKDFIQNNIDDKDYDDFAMFVEAEFGFDLYHEDPYGLWSEEELNSWLSAWLTDREDPEGREMMNENTKITLTIGHIKKLVKESKNVGDSEWFRRDVERSVREEFRGNIYDLNCYYDGDDSFINKRDFVIEGQFGRKENGHYPEEKNRLYAAIRKAGGTNIICRVFNSGGFDVAFDIQEKKLAEYRAKEEKWQAEKDSEKAAEMDIIKQEVGSFDISKYKPNEKVLEKIKDYMDRGSKVNVKAITGYEKLLTYYWAAAILGWDELMNDIRRKLMSEDFYKLGKVEGDTGSGVYMFKFPELSVITKLQKRFMQLKWLWGEGSPDGEFILGILNKIKTEAMKKSAPEINENTKVTLTLGQLKKLVNENSYYPDWDYCLECALDWCSNEKGAIEDILKDVSCEWKFRVCDDGYPESERHLGHALVNINLDRWYHIYGYDIYSKGNKVTDEELLAAAKAQGIELSAEELKSIHENIAEISDRVMRTAHDEDPGEPWEIDDGDWIDRDRD